MAHPARRLAARTTIKLVAALIGATSVLVNVAVAPLPIVSNAVLAGLGFALTAVYVECSLTVIRRRLRWEADRRPLSSLGVGAARGARHCPDGEHPGVVGMAAGSLHLLASADIPTVSELAARLLEL